MPIKFNMIEKVFQVFSQMMLHQHLKCIVITTGMHRVETSTE